MARVNRTTGFFLVLGVVVLLGTVAGAYALKPGEQPGGVDGGNAEPSVFCSGNVDVASGLAVLVPSVPGKVQEVLVKEGEAVKAGQVLVRLDDREARDQLAVAEQGLVVARAKLEGARKTAQQVLSEYRQKMIQQQNLLDQATAATTYAQADLRRARSHLKERLSGDVDIRADQAETTALQAQKNKEAAEKGLAELKSMDPAVSLKEHEEALKEAELKVQAARSKLDMFVIKAPSNGTIFEINYQIGGPCPLPLGDANVSRAMIFCPDETLVVRAEVDQEWAMKVKAGMNVTLTFQAPDGVYRWNGTVEKVSRYIQRRRSRVTDPDQFNDARTRECLIRLEPNSKNEIIHGMRMSVQIHTGN